MKNYFQKHFLQKNKIHQKSATDNAGIQSANHDSVQDFIRTGLFSLSFVLLMTGAVYLLQNTVTVTSSPNGKELPIYCVDRDDNKIALSFDAAWGNIILC